MMRFPRGVPGGVARTGVALLAALAVAVSWPRLAGADERLEGAGPPASLADAVARGRAAVVTLKAAETGRLRGQLVDHELRADDLLQEPDSEDDDADTGDVALGSAVLIDASGIAVTTARLGRRVSDLQAITSDGRRLSATLVARDDETDVAILRVCCDARPFPAITLGDSARLRAGDRVVAIGAPFGLEASATVSVVAAVLTVEHDGLEGLIQTGGSVTSGYAGGPLVDTRGVMVGLVIGHAIGTGVALPSNMVRTIVSTLLEHGRIRRGWLGATAQPLDPTLALAFGAREAAGVVVVDVRRGSPAARAGLRPGDIIRALDGRRFDSPTDLAAAIAKFTPGRRVTLSLWRRGRDVVLVVPLDEEPDEDAVGSLRSRTKARLGVEVGTITSDIGVVVSAVEPGSRAARAGLRRGDVIRELNGRATRSMADLEEMLDELLVATRIVILLQRGASSSYITFAP